MKSSFSYIIDSIELSLRFLSGFGIIKKFLPIKYSTTALLPISAILSSSVSFLIVL